MEEENKELSEPLEEKKKRGRPKKVVETSQKAQESVIVNENMENKEMDIDLEKKRLEDRIKQLEMEQSIKVIVPPLADKENFPSEVEAKALENKVGDTRLPEKKEDISFWGKLFKKNKFKKDGTVAVQLLHPQGDATLHYIETDKDGSFKIEDEQYHINEHCVYRLKIKKDYYPLCILPTWTMIPIGTKAWFELSQERRGHELERIILNAIKKEERVKMDDGKKKGKMSAKTIWIVIAVIVIGYFLLKSSGKI